jgi:hypothetical protein
MRTPSALLLLTSLLVAAGCSSSDNVSWWFVSDNASGSGSGGSGGVITVRGGDGNRPLRIAGDGNRLISASGMNSEERNFTAHLAVRSDVAVLETGQVVELRTPALPSTVTVQEGRVAIQSGPILFRIDVPAGQEPLPGLAGPGSFHVFSDGNLVLFENYARIFVFQEGDQPERFDPATTRWSVAGNSLRLDSDSGTRLIPPPAPAPPEKRVSYVSARRAMRLFGPRGGVTAELPEDRVEVSNGADGLLLSGKFPGGLPGVRRVPFAVFLPLQNRHLLLVEG